MSDALPLAAEPTSAALDLILEAVSSRFSRSDADRAAALAALSCSRADDGEELTRESVERARSRA